LIGIAGATYTISTAAGGLITLG